MSETFEKISAVLDGEVPPAGGEVEGLSLDGLADIPYANETPAEWDADYRKIWQELQVAMRNKSQLRAHVTRLNAENARLNDVVVQAREDADNADRLRHVSESELTKALNEVSELTSNYQRLDCIADSMVDEIDALKDELTKALELLGEVRENSKELLAGWVTADWYSRRNYLLAHQSAPAAELIQSKGVGDWTVCILNDRVWSPVSPNFSRKRDAAKWMAENGYAPAAKDGE